MAYRMWDLVGQREAWRDPGILRSGGHGVWRDRCGLYGSVVEPGGSVGEA